MIDGTGIDVDTGKGSALGFHGVAYMSGIESNNALTTSIDSSMSKFCPKRAKHFSKGSS